jgi:hypothetical protein
MAALSTKGYGHSVERIDSDAYRISWCVDRKSAGSRTRTTVITTRWTDAAGAKRFASKWGLRT